MPHKLQASIFFNTEAHGPIDVDFQFDRFADLDTIVENGLGLSAITQINIVPVHHRTDSLTPNSTIEDLVRRLHQVDDMKHDAIDGADQHLARSNHVPTVAEKQTDVQTETQVRPLERKVFSDGWTGYQRALRDLFAGGTDFLQGAVIPG